jgi:hypothetical protein
MIDSRTIDLIKVSFSKFNINLKGKIVLTEAATGNYCCTSILAAIAGAKVYAIAKDSKYGSFETVQSEVLLIAKQLGVDSLLTIIRNFDEIDLELVDIVTNTGFVRPIDKNMINKLKPDCVIPLMWEPWEYRSNELDLNAAIKRGIKVYGTNENDFRLQTMNYIGLTVLYFLLKEKKSPASSKILVIGCQKFNNAIELVLNKLNYNVVNCLTDEFNNIDIHDFDNIVIAEHINPQLIIGQKEDALINYSLLTKNQLIIHISGNVDLSNISNKQYPEYPAPFGYMSYTTDFIDPIAVFDLHAAGLKVAEGMLKAKENGLTGHTFKTFVESNYPGLAFENIKYW